MPFRERQDFREWSERAGRDDIGGQGFQILDSGVVKRNVDPRYAGGFDQE